MRFRHAAPLLALGLLVPSAQASISLTFSEIGTSSLTGISDSTGAAPVDGLTWGIIIDTEGDGLPDLSGALGLNLADGIDLGTSDLVFLGGTTTSMPPFANETGSGAITTSTGMEVYQDSATTGVDANDPFALIWFDQGISGGDELAPGTHYGLIENGAFLLPADGGDVSFASLFAGGASNLYPANLTLVPEPSLGLFALASLVPLLRRRRR